VLWCSLGWWEKKYSHQAEIFIEDALRQELEAEFPGQLNAQTVGEV
jgi:hypothetical protein